MKDFPGSLVVKTLNAAGTGLIPNLGTKVLHAAQHSQKKKKGAEAYGGKGVCCVKSHGQLVTEQDSSQIPYCTQFPNMNRVKLDYR